MLLKIIDVGLYSRPLLLKLTAHEQQKDGLFKDVHLKEGEMLLLPG